jgi:hypothetical protein
MTHRARFGEGRSFVLALGLVFASAREARAEVETYVAHLDGAQVVPSRETAATGVAEFQLDTATKKVTGKVVFKNLESSQLKSVKIESGACGEQPNAPRFTIDPPNSQGVTTIFPFSLLERMAEFQSGAMYVVLRTSARPGGEIRGQIYKKGSPAVCPKAAPAPAPSPKPTSSATPAPSVVPSSSGSSRPRRPRR